MEYGNIQILQSEPAGALQRDVRGDQTVCRKTLEGLDRDFQDHPSSLPFVDSPLT